MTRALVVTAVLSLFCIPAAADELDLSEEHGFIIEYDDDHATIVATETLLLWSGGRFVGKLSPSWLRRTRHPIDHVVLVVPEGRPFGIIELIDCSVCPRCEGCPSPPPPPEHGRFLTPEERFYLKPWTRPIRASEVREGGSP